jgi:hypothetical protein
MADGSLDETSPRAILEVDKEQRKSLLFALVAERLSAYYEHAQWLTEAQGATLAGLWLTRAKLQMAQQERRQLSDLSDQMARGIAASLSREAGLYTAHEMMEALDPNYRSEVVCDLLDACAQLLHENDMAG